jgi:adenylate cyclase class 2
MIEIEKKYRLSGEQNERISKKLETVGAEFDREDFEENVLFGGGLLNFKACALRLRKTEGKAILTYKERLPSESAIKRQIEHETEISDPEVMREILENLGYKPALVYEKRRKTWRLLETEIVLDELPFGLFMEIEGAAEAIPVVEKMLEIEDLPAVMETYPQLTFKHGAKINDMIEARFK